MKVHGRSARFVVTFAAVFAIVYYFAVAYNWALFSYGPVAAAGVATLVAALPQPLTRWLWPGFAWLVPIGSIAAFAHLLGGYFTR